MKILITKFKNLTALAVVLTLTVAGVLLGVFSPAAAFLIAAAWQLSQFALCAPSARLFTAGLTPSQVREFEEVMSRMSGFYDEYSPVLKTLKERGGSLETVLKEFPDLQGKVAKLRKFGAGGAFGPGNTGVRWVGGVPFVTDECAQTLCATFVLECSNIRNGMDRLVRDAGARERVLAAAYSTLGIQSKAAMTDTQIPLPTHYAAQIVELAFAWGAARQFATVFPMGAGSVKLPRLKAGEDDFGYLGVGTASMSQPVPEKRVAAELITFDSNKAGGIIRLPTELEEDTFIPIGQFLARYIGRQLAKLEDRTMFLADGSGTYANQTGVGPYCVANPDYLVVLGAGKTKVNDAALEDLRKLRGKVSPAVLANMAAHGQTAAAYYMHPTMEPLLSSFNKYPNFVVFKNENGKPTLDGWPVRWIGAAAVNNDQAAPEEFVAYFGDLTFWYLGERGTPRIETSREVFFETDEIALRAVERIDVNGMAVDAMAALRTAAE